jgi:hypothetical protein
MIDRLIEIGKMVHDSLGIDVHISSKRHSVTMDIIYILTAEHDFHHTRETIEVRVDEGYFWQGGEDRWIYYQFYCLAYRPKPGRDLIRLDPSEWPPSELRRLVSVCLLRPGIVTSRVDVFPAAGRYTTTKGQDQSPDLHPLHLP